MDTLLIVGAVATTSRAVPSALNPLYKLVHETRNVDQTVKDLATEVDALNRALYEVETVLKDPNAFAAKKRASADDSKQLWQTLYGSLEDCQITVARIDSALDAVRKRRSNWATQIMRQVKLNQGKDELVLLRLQTHTHGNALQIALQMVTMLEPSSYHLS